MTRFVYVLPAGRFRWEVRVAPREPTSADTIDGLKAAYGDMLMRLVSKETDVAKRQDMLNRLERVLASRDQADLDSYLEAEPQFYRLKRDALIAARAIAIIIGGEVQPHDRRGRIQDPDSYGPDPRESHG